ncbi:MAG: IS21-like element helper ATPase IstB [Lachnospiraceae bacterium]|nr:IS21-like element helper ATPase IstB [Lachnospiraceae bacterium]
MDKIRELKEQAASLSLYNTRDKIEDLIHQAEQEELSYTVFIGNVLSSELKYRHDKAQIRRIKDAGFPYLKRLKDFDLTFCKSLTKKQFKQLSELTWIDGIYNLILSGPPGVGKTHLAIGIGYQACEDGYKVSYSTMQSLVQCLRTEEIDRRSRAKMNRIRKSNLLIIDEVGYLPINPTEGNLFFQLISELQEQTSIIITTNKGFEEWAEFLNDPALATAILDRLSYRCDRIKISGKSYRLENRQSFLNNGGSDNEV